MRMLVKIILSFFVVSVVGISVVYALGDKVNLRLYQNPPGVTYNVSNTTRLYAEDMNEIREGIALGRRGIFTNFVQIKDVDATPTSDMILTVEDGVLKFRDSTNTNDLPIELQGIPINITEKQNNWVLKYRVSGGNEWLELGSIGGSCPGNNAIVSFDGGSISCQEFTRLGQTIEESELGFDVVNQTEFDTSRIGKFQDKGDVVLNTASTIDCSGTRIGNGNVFVKLRVKTSDGSVMDLSSLNTQIGTTGVVNGDMCLIESEKVWASGGVVFGDGNGVVIDGERSCRVADGRSVLFVFDGTVWRKVGGSCGGNADSIDNIPIRIGTKSDGRFLTYRTIGEEEWFELSGELDLSGTNSPVFCVDSDGENLCLRPSGGRMRLETVGGVLVPVVASSFEIESSGSEGGSIVAYSGDSANQPGWVAMEQSYDGGVSKFGLLFVANGKLRYKFDGDGVLDAPLDSDGNNLAVVRRDSTSCSNINGSVDDFCIEGDKAIKVHNGTSWKRVSNVVDSCEVVIENPVETDEMEFCYRSQARVLTRVSCECYGTCTTPPSISICSGEDLGDDTCATPIITGLSCTTDGIVTTSLSNTSLGADGSISLLITNTPSADSSKLRVTVEYEIQ